MNEWLHRSIEYANKQNYLDDLFNVYPIIPSGKRKINPYIWKEVELAFKAKKQYRTRFCPAETRTVPDKGQFHRLPETRQKGVEPKSGASEKNLRPII